MSGTKTYSVRAKYAVFFTTVLILLSSVGMVLFQSNHGIDGLNRVLAFQSPSSGGSPPNNGIQDQSSSIPSSQQFALAVHLRTHLYTFFEQPVSVKIKSPDGSIFQSSTATVHPRSEKIVNFNIPSSFVENGKSFNVCVTNDKYNKEDCSEVTKNSQSSSLDISMTVP